MTFEICVSGRDIRFGCAAEEPVLDAAERAGYALPYCCRKGVCQSCEGELVRGKALEAAQGEIIGPRSSVLFCQLRPRSDLEISPRRIESRAPPLRKQLTAVVFRLIRPAPEVTILHLRYPANERVRFRAGQYLQVILDDGTRRNYSMAGPPQETDGTALHIRHIPGGQFSEGVLAQLTRGSRLRSELPFGEFFLRSEDVARPTILLAGGTGIAPIVSMIEDLRHRGSARPLYLYWGVRRQEDFYLGDLPARWQRYLPQLRFVPVLSEPELGWRGRAGLVHRAVLEDHTDLSDYEVYASGAPAMVAAAREDFIAHHGLKPEAFFSDAFVPSGG
jgi:NAD(P)H-flavin reductase/ferredoxin